MSDPETDHLEELVEHVKEFKHEGATITVASVKVSASEKVSTGQYENYSPHATLEGDIILPGEYGAHREALKAQLLQMHTDLQAVLGESIDKRLSDVSPHPEEMR